MGLSKSEEFTVKDNKIARYARALSHPARIAILQVLLKNQTCICGDIVEVLPLSQSTVSQHLRELKDAGLIKGEIEGVKTCYCIDEKNWKLVKEVFALFFDQSVNAKKCC